MRADQTPYNPQRTQRRSGEGNPPTRHPTYPQNVEMPFLVLMTKTPFHLYRADLHIHYHDHLILETELDVYAEFEAHARVCVAIIGLMAGLPQVKS